MPFQNVFYNGHIRATIVAFGNLFSNIYIDRKQGSSTSGTTIQRLQIPLAYGPKEKYLVRLDSDPTLENNVLTSLPRLSFEITGYNYDAQRKTSKMSKISCGTGVSGVSQVRSPAPYNIDIQLSILTKNQEDALQILEQILPIFVPEYTISINSIPSMNIVQDVPIILNGVNVQDDYDGDFLTRRFVIHTLNFTLKLNLFGAVTTSGVILTSKANISMFADYTNPAEVYTATGNPSTGNINDSWADNI